MALHFLLTKKARDYTLEDVNKMSELEVVQFFAQLRWGNDGRQTCPKCGTINRHQFVRVRRQWRCKDCGHTFSVTSGTILADHKLPLKILLQAVLLFVVQVKGVSACQMSRVLGVTYKTAFTLLHKLREALVAQRDASPSRTTYRSMAGISRVAGANPGRSRRSSTTRCARKRRRRFRHSTATGASSWY